VHEWWSILRRTLGAPAMPLVAAGAVVAAWLSTLLAEASLGANEGFVDEVRQGAALFGGALVLSLAEPLEVGREARSGLLAVRLSRTRTSGLAVRALALSMSTWPVVAAVSLAAGGLPPDPVSLVVELFVLAAGGLALGSVLDRHLLVPALWGLLVVAHLRPWLAEAAWGAPLAWVLPRMGDMQGPLALAHGVAWGAAALLLAGWRLDVAAGRPA